MKRARKSSQRTITARIPVELLSQILANPENISLCHALVGAIISAERIRRPEGIAAELDDGNLHPVSSPEADSMAEDARRRVERAKERRERCLQRTEKRVAILLKVMRDKKPVELSAIFGSGLFTPEQERAIDALLNPTVRTIRKLSFEQLRAYFMPLFVRVTDTDINTLPAADRRHAGVRPRNVGERIKS